MQKPLRTNPAYAHLAYRKTIVAHTKVLLRRKFLGDEVSGPRETLVCEEVFPVDARIPPEAIQEYIEGLSREEAELDVELRRFELTTREPNEQKRPQGTGVQNSKGRQRNRKGGRPN
jgi:hypothetical protein